MPDQPKGFYCIHRDFKYYKLSPVVPADFPVKKSKYHPNPDNTVMGIVIASLHEEICTANTGKLCLLVNFFSTIYSLFESVHLFTLCDQSSSCICTMFTTSCLHATSCCQHHATSCLQLDHLYQQCFCGIVFWYSGILKVELF